MIATLTASPLLPEVLSALAPGSIVRLPDETLAEVVSSTHAQVRVLHGYLRMAGLSGAGPWVFQRWQVEDATETEQEAYRAACMVGVTGFVFVAVSR